MSKKKKNSKDNFGFSENPQTARWPNETILSALANHFMILFHKHSHHETPLHVI
jgi:hypothetical protein